MFYDRGTKNQVGRDLTFNSGGDSRAGVGKPERGSRSAGGDTSFPVKPLRDML